MLDEKHSYVTSELHSSIFTIKKVKFGKTPIVPFIPVS